MSLPGAAGRGGSVSAPDPDRQDLSFPRSLRLTQRKQFQTVYREGRRARSSSFGLFGLPNNLDHCRLGITVTRKVGCAAVRNRIKRMVREVFRLNVHRLTPPLDLVVHAYPGFEPAGAAELEPEFLRCFHSLARRFER